MPRGIVIEIIGDERSYLRSVERTMASNTKLDASFKTVAVNAGRSADAQIAAAVKSQEAMRANVAALQARAAALPAGSAEQKAATALAIEQQAKLNRALGTSTVATSRLGSGAKTAERDLNKMTRGVASGSGILGRFSRSLAFASTGFIAFATGAVVIRESIVQAENLAKAQRSLGTAIGHTGGDLKELQPLYERTAKAAAQFGVNQVDATTGLARATVLTGNAAAAQRAYQEALVISKATGKEFNTALTATSKAQEGITTSLRRYGILVTPTMKGTDQFRLVMKRFGGQAEANTTASERLSASFANLEASVGEALLPTFEKLTNSLTAWFTKMTESGQLQKNVGDIVGALTVVFRDLGKVIGAVDKITGSFAHTLELLAGLKLASVLAGLVAKWGAVAAAANIATSAETRALTVGAGSAGAAGAAASGGRLAALAGNPAVIIPVGIALTQQPQVKKAQSDLQKALGPFKLLGTNLVDVGKKAVDATRNLNTMTDALLGMNQTAAAAIPIVRIAGLPNLRAPFQGAGPARQGPFGTAKPMTQFFKQFHLNFAEQLGQVQASLTRSSKDDVAVARQIVARIKRRIDEGRLRGPALLQALQLEASALSTIWSAEDAAAQKRAQRAQAAKDRIQAQIEAAIDPVRLELQLARAQLSGSTPAVIGALKALRAAARKMLNSGKLSAQQQIEAIQQIISLNQQIKDAATQSTVQFQVPARLAFRLARDTALGRSTTKDLLAIRAAILRFIKHHRDNLAALTDAYNQLASINEQLGQTAGTALGLFKQASTAALTAGLGLTDTQRKALKARLSQLGPGGTVPGQGVGAAGFVIGPDGRPIGRGRGGVPRTLQGGRETAVSPARFNRLLSVLERTANRPIRVIVDLDGKIIADNTTRHQQRRRQRNSSQRRGPNAATA